MITANYPRQFRDTTPLYMQVARKLMQDLRDGRYQADQALPAERLLSEQLDISRVTARKAIDQLVEQGLVVRKRGSGNYVAPRIEQPLAQLSGFSEQLQQSGYRAGSTWLRRAMSSASGDEQQALGLAPGARVARLERLRLADDVVMAYEVTALPSTVLSRPDAVGGSLYEYLSRKGRQPVRALQKIRAMNACADIAARLEVPVGRAVLFVTRTGFDAAGVAVELTHSWCRSDHYDLVAEMHRAA
ncbi:GntR family transcriptional regulator [Pseudoduganella sp. GCM10020061]|uniref:GntR family transcriptional regulator n=1 Tax=Pseudoduganella sp. GCM10020061 TaxID=3317345 RepID=UPI00363B2AF7